ncbi:thiamine-phosphate kinase [Dongia deserti]|uniref:thiamine-phosphate kinase n=1 Tax=Dongia deserti TaxID=2268030 RepID=UPI002549BC6F|nr:thiamine-phosphate kinase [Dongia deserti]
MTAKGKLPGEFELIARHFAPLAAQAPGAVDLQDDVFAFTPPPGMDLVLKTDAITAGVHFLRSDPPDLVARKLLRVNLSDLAGKGARPLGYLMTTAFDDAIDEAWVAKFVEGLAQDQAEFGIALWGGDTTATPGPLAFTATVIGAVPTGRTLRRSGARPGDRILVTGTVGDGIFGLAAHRGELTDLAEPARHFLAQRYVLPEPRLALGRMLVEQGLAHASMDISDGLAADLAHICEASCCGATVEVASVPLSEPVAELVAADPALIASVVTGGDDYELLLAVPPSNLADAFEAARKAETRITDIGVFSPQSAMHFIDRDGHPLTLKEQGFTHF